MNQTRVLNGGLNSVFVCGIILDALSIYMIQSCFFSSVAVVLRGLVLSYSWKCTIQCLPGRGDALITKYTIKWINPSFQETHLRHK